MDAKREDRHALDCAARKHGLKQARECRQTGPQRPGQCVGIDSRQGNVGAEPVDEQCAKG